MKILRNCLVVLCLSCAQDALAQTLTIGQLATLYKLEQMQQDAYLVERGWKFFSTNEQGDSTRSVYWRYHNSAGLLLSEVGVENKVGERSSLSYSTLLRPAFDAIRRAVLAVPMDVLGTDNDGAMRTFYRDSKYDVALVISNLETNLDYHFSMRQHGFTKAYREGENGKLIPEWIVLPPMTGAQKKYYDSMADTVKWENEATRLRVQPKIPQKKPRK